MHPCFFSWYLPLSHLFDEIDATTWAIEFITQNLISGTSRSAEAAVNAFTKNSGGLNTLRGISELGGELSLHIKI
jgi:hypothetical protein